MSLNYSKINPEQIYLVDHVLKRIVKHTARSLAKSQIVKTKKLQPIIGSELQVLVPVLNKEGYEIVKRLSCDPRPATKRVIVLPQAHELLYTVSRCRTEKAVYPTLESIGDVFLAAVSPYLERTIEADRKAYSFWGDIAIAASHLEESTGKGNRAYLRINAEAANKIETIAKEFGIPANKLMSAFILTQVTEKTPTQLDLIKERSERLSKKIEVSQGLTA